MATELAKAYIQIIPSAQGIKGKITEELGGEATSAGRDSGNKIASAIKTAIAAAGIGTALKQSLLEGADLQQSIGGIETLFKDSANAVIENAKNAYKTAGMSANEYMETVTSFAASLLQGLGGDTAAAAEIADMALTDMADNANKMGTSMELIQNAYQGFAKQNYTMLDNLKLGYGGTQKEMSRLLEDAKAITGIEYDIDNLSDVYSAIHVIQQEMGITGATAAEAAGTFSGSLAAMKAAANNLLGNLALGENIGPSLSALGETVYTFAIDNLLPMVGNIVVSIGQAIVNTNWIEVAGNTITRLRNDLSAKAFEILGTDGDIMGAVCEAIRVNAPMIARKGLDTIREFAAGLKDNLPELASAAGVVVADWLAEIGAHLPEIFEKGITMIGKLIAGAISEIPEVLKCAAEIISNFFSAFSSYDWRGIGTNIIEGIKNGLMAGLGAIADAAKNVAKSALDAAKSFLGIASPSKVMSEQVGKWIPAGIAAGIEGNMDVITSAMDDITAATASGFNAQVSAAVETGRVVLESSGSGESQSEMLKDLYQQLPDILAEAISNMRLEVNGREFARLVREV